MEERTGTQATEFLGVGGAIRNAFWMQNKADMVGRPVRIPEVDEATVLGAAILAGIGAGAYQNADEAYQRVARESTVYQPREELTRLYAELFPIYRELYKATAPINHALYDRFMVK
jgi:sugar (pentulose or hexulose) kinase